MTKANSNNTNKNVSMPYRSYSHGKLLLTAEYFVLESAKALAIPTVYGQGLEVKPIKEKQLIWESYTHEQKCWLEAVFDLPALRLVSASFEAAQDGGNDKLAENLLEILVETKKLNPNFLNSPSGFFVKTSLDFPRNWGLGTSSTLINNIAQWAAVNPYELLQHTFGGSGYDIACAQHHSPIIYTKNGIHPKIETVNFNPSFKKNLFFIFLNKKQNSREGINRFNTLKGKLSSEITQISAITEAFVSCKTIIDFEKLIKTHEEIVSKIIRLKPVQEQFFSDYYGQTKSLGAWGGDFILATGNSNTPDYFKKKGFETVIPYEKLILNSFEEKNIEKFN